jgi:AraC-like DNA-binding protein
MLRRLDRVRERLVEGAPLAHTAYACGFSDQAHLTRQFKSAYGLTPRAWQRLVRTRLHDRSIKPGPGSLPRLDKQPV